MFRTRSWFGIFFLLFFTFLNVAPVLAQTTPCSTDPKEKCYKIDRTCSSSEDCLNNIGKSTCFDGECHLDEAAKREYDRNKTGFIWGTIELQNDIGEFKKPALQIRVPGLTFSDVRMTLDKDGYIHIPYIGEMITALYKYGIALASILAVVLIIKSGVSIILSGGGEEKVAAYHQIGQICIGLIILWGSYAFLYTINPSLVEFKPLRIKYIEPIPLPVYVRDDPSTEPGATLGEEKPGYIKYQCKAQPGNKTLGDTTYDAIFQKYGECIPMDWRVLKAMSFVESAHREDVTNCSGFTGLFQTKTKYANSAATSAGTKVSFGNPSEFESIGKVNPQLAKAEPSTFVGTIMLKNSLSLINTTCPKADENSINYFLYVGHQSGQGALKNILKKSCETSESPKNIAEFYKKYKTNRSSDEIANESDSGAKRFLRFISDLGASGTKKVDPKKCPLTNESLRKLL